MGIKIHHGPDGTFKTSGAIKDDILPVIKNGRTLVTNVRGFSRENAVKVLGRKKVHKDFKVIFVDTEVQEGRDKLARFFHWAPKGAFFVVDEVQRIFKPKWTAKDIALLAYQGGAAAKDDDRPEDFDTAWDMQRHHNWDFVFTTTSITKVRSEMRDMAKVAVRHYNLGIWRFYKTVEHASDNKGTTASQQSAIRYFNWVPKKVFALYSSTKTGTFTNSEPKTPVYRDPKIIGLLSFLVIFWTYLLGKPAPIKARDANADSSQQVKNDTKQVSDKTDEMATKGNSSSDSDTNNNDVSNVKHYKMGAIEPFIKVTTITGSVFSGVNSHYMFTAKVDDNELSFSSLDLYDRGYEIEWINKCKAAITRDESTEYVYCSMDSLILPKFIAQNETEKEPNG